MQLGSKQRCPMHTARDVWWLTAVRPAMLASHARRAAGGLRRRSGGVAGAGRSRRRARVGGPRASERPFAARGRGGGGGAAWLDEGPSNHSCRSPVQSVCNITRFHLHMLWQSEAHTQAPLEALHPLPDYPVLFQHCFQKKALLLKRCFKYPTTQHP